jgi:hypothetical protein
MEVNLVHGLTAVDHLVIYPCCHVSLWCVGFWLVVKLDAGGMSNTLDGRCVIDLFNTIIKEALFMWPWEFQLNSQPGILVFPKEENHWYTWCVVISLCFMNSHLPEFQWNHRFASTTEYLVVVILYQYHPNTDSFKKKCILACYSAFCAVIETFLT